MMTRVMTRVMMTRFNYHSKTCDSVIKSLMSHDVI